MNRRQVLVAQVCLAIFAATASVCWFALPQQQGDAGFIVLVWAIGFSVLTAAWTALLITHYRMSRK